MYSCLCFSGVAVCTAACVLVVLLCVQLPVCFSGVAVCTAACVLVVLLYVQLPVLCFQLISKIVNISLCDHWVNLTNHLLIVQPSCLF